LFIDGDFAVVVMGARIIIIGVIVPVVGFDDAAAGLCPRRSRDDDRAIRHVPGFHGHDDNVGLVVVFDRRVGTFFASRAAVRLVVGAVVAP
jgi:hypothetical protein